MNVRLIICVWKKYMRYSYRVLPCTSSMAGMCKYRKSNAEFVQCNGQKCNTVSLQTNIRMLWLSTFVIFYIFESVLIPKYRGAVTLILLMEQFISDYMKINVFTKILDGGKNTIKSIIYMQPLAISFSLGLLCHNGKDLLGSKKCYSIC